MKFDFSNVDDVQSYVSVPPGKHVCRVTEVRPGVARDGSTRWTFRLEVVGSPHHGRTAAWDSLTWSDRGVGRVRHVLKGLGVQTHGVVEIEPQDLVGRRAQVQIQLEERENPQTGRREMRTRVPYAGYQPIDGDSTGNDFTGRDFTGSDFTGHDATGHDSLRDESTGHESIGHESTERDSTENASLGEAQSTGSPLDACLRASLQPTNQPFGAITGPNAASSTPADRRSSNDNLRFQPGRTTLGQADELEADPDDGEHTSPFGRTGGHVYEAASLSGRVQRAQLVSEATHADVTETSSAWGSSVHGFEVGRDEAHLGDAAAWSHHPALCAPAAGEPADGHGAKGDDGGAGAGSPTAAGSDGLAIPAKRRPGRPRKHPLPPGQPTAPSKPQPTSEAPKRRGRKPKDQGSA